MKRFLTDNFGYTLRNIRENLKLTQTEVFHGLLARSTWSNYESGNMIPDMITFITLLERMGVSPDRFEFIVSKDVHRFYEWYDECLFCIENNDWNELIEKRKEFKILKQINIKIQCQYRDFIDYVIERFAHKNMDRALYHIKSSITNTIKDIDTIVVDNKLLSIFEWHILVNYYDLTCELKLKDSKELYSLYEYCKFRLQDNIINVGVLPRLALILLKYANDNISRESRLNIECETLKILVKNYVIREIPEILKYMVQDDMSYGMSKIRSYQRNALVSVFEEYGVCPDFRVELQRFYSRKYLLLADVLKIKRLELGLTKEEVIGNLCSLSTYTRAESGKTTPNNKTLSLLKKRLKLRAVYYRSEIEVDDINLLMLNSEYRRLTAVGRTKEAELTYNKLFKKLDMSIPINKQIMEFFKVYKHSDEEVKLDRLLNLLAFDEVSINDRLLFSREEIEILSFISWEKSKSSEKKGIEFIEDIFEKESRLRRTYYSRTAILKRDLVKLLKNNKEYDRSDKLAVQAIKTMFNENDAGLLLDMLDFISTIEEESGNKKEAFKICKDMFYISELYELYDDAENIRNYYENNFNKNEIWY